MTDGFMCNTCRDEGNGCDCGKRAVAVGARWKLHAKLNGFDLALFNVQPLK
jgi:acetone carboxylase gamma subunit